MMNSVRCWQKVMGDQRPELAVGFFYKEALISLAVLQGSEETKARSQGVRDISFKAGTRSVCLLLCA